MGKEPVHVFNVVDINELERVLLSHPLPRAVITKACRRPSPSLTTSHAPLEDAMTRELSVTLVGEVVSLARFLYENGEVETFALALVEARGMIVSLLGQSWFEGSEAAAPAGSAGEEIPPPPAPSSGHP